AVAGASRARRPRACRRPALPLRRRQGGAHHVPPSRQSRLGLHAAEECAHRRARRGDGPSGVDLVCRQSHLRSDRARASHGGRADDLVRARGAAVRPWRWHAGDGSGNERNTNMPVRWIIAAVGALGLALVTVYVPKPWTRTAGGAKTAACPANAKAANLDFTMKDMHGTDVKLADFKGK